MNRFMLFEAKTFSFSYNAHITVAVVVTSVHLNPPSANFLNAERSVALSGVYFRIDSVIKYRGFIKVFLMKMEIGILKKPWGAFVLHPGAERSRELPRDGDQSAALLFQNSSKAELLNNYLLCMSIFPK